MSPTINNVTDTFSVAPQITVNDLDAIKQQGFTKLICNRPNNEEPNQPDFAQIHNAAKDCGLECHYLPFVAADISPDLVQQFESLFDPSDKTLAFCRSGTRSITIWALSQYLQGVAQEHILELCSQAGYDLSNLFS